MLRHALVGISLAASLVLAAPAAMGEEPLTGVELAARAGYAFPFGTLASGRPLGDLVSGHFAAVLDTGYRITPHLYVGFGFQYGIVQVRGDSTTTCVGIDIGCSGRDYRISAVGIYHLLPARRIDPWLGLGVGYELMSISISGRGQSTGAAWHGFEFLEVLAGADFATVVPRLFVAPVVQLSVGRFSYGSVTTGGKSESLPMPSPGTHEWLTLGLRVTYLL